MTKYNVAVKKAIEHLKANDPVLGAVIGRCPPPQLGVMPATFYSLARSVVYQQLSMGAARTIFGRVEEACGGKLTPEALLKVKTERLRACGLSKQKLAYIRDLAEKTSTGELKFSHLHKLSDEQVIEELTRVKGVGKWTAHMFMIFALGRPDVLATGDLGVQTAVKKLYRLRAAPKPERIEKIGKAWRPYASYACWYLWRWLEAEKNGK